MYDFIHGKPLSSFIIQFLVHFLILLNKLVSLYEIFSNSIIHFSLYVEILLSPMRVVSLVLLSLDMKNCSYCLKFETQHDGIRISDAVNMARSIIIFPNYVRMIDFLNNSCVIQQIQGGCTILLDLVYCSFFEDEFDLFCFSLIPIVDAD